MIIHLFREGTFYRAYEWSAWLCARFFPDLKVTHRILKGGEDIVFVGFPLTSLDRFTPEGSNVIPLDDNSVEIKTQGMVFPDGSEINTLQTGYLDWKQCQPLTEASKKKEEEKKLSDRNPHPRLTDVMLQILAYPIEQHSPMQCMGFLSDVKKQLSEIL